ncbi:hypothetical protein [Streptomyces sp. NPDC056470]|uniref:hypothetical protein n=1 Tax=unclassified Streptomyces TaxID=2593676 RepID=UPI0036A99EA0
MTGPGEAQGLGALPHARVQDPQPLAHRVAAGYLLVELAGDELLADGLAQPAVPARPG